MCLALTSTESHRGKLATAFLLSGGFYLLADNLAVNTLFLFYFIGFEEFKKF